MSDRIGEVIATRIVTDGDRPVLIEVGMPDHTANGRGCSGFRIEGLGEYTVDGVDEMAALYNALFEVGEVLERANDNGHDFPVPGPSAMDFPATPSRSRIPVPTAEPAVCQVIALRILITDGEPVAVEIDRPTRARERPYYVCSFRVDGRREAVASGFDEIEALFTALRMIGAWLGLPQDWPLTRAS
ncbi:hypothetical protein ABZ319_19135 [Nocardia sp. NPDC005978]|uniref:DUF6968 family protein n=1 Tax=Nocardia sp. NPDC005978 TaxID=3156725 RepID=UPI0033A36AC8